MLQLLGKSISAAGVVCGLGQTIIAIKEGDDFSVGDWMNVISTSLGAVAIISAPFPVVAGSLGVASGIIGIVSVFFSYNIQPGLYKLDAHDGTYIYLHNGFIVSMMENKYLTNPPKVWMIMTWVIFCLVVGINIIAIPSELSVWYDLIYFIFMGLFGSLWINVYWNYPILKDDYIEIKNLLFPSR